MKIKGKTSLKPANLFFIELLIVLVFFSFSIAVILRIFAAADHKQKISELTEKSVICAQSVAEAFSVCGELSEAAKLVFGTEDDFGSSARLLLNDNMKVEEGGGVTLVLRQNDEKTEAGKLSYLDMDFSVCGENIYTVICTAYTPYNGGDSNE